MEKEDILNKIIERRWPLGYDSVFCLNFDDFCPFKIGKYDYGRIPYKGINVIHDKLLSQTNVKITHFVVPSINFWFPKKYLGKIINIPSNRYKLCNPKNIDWLNYVKGLIDTEKVEIAWHGYKHFNSNFYRKKHIEFINYNYEKSKNELDKAFEIFKTVGIEVNGFRQPGWGINQDLSLLEVLKSYESIDYIAASSSDAGLNERMQQVSNYEPQWYKGLLNIPQNVTIGNDPKITINEIESIINNEQIISLKGHYCNVEWVSNSLTINNVNNLFSIIEYLKDKNIWYSTFSEVAKHYKIISTMDKSIIKNNDDYIISYKFSKPCPGFSVHVNAGTKLKRIVVSDTCHVNIENGNSYEIIFTSKNLNEYQIVI